MTIFFTGPFNVILVRSFILHFVALCILCVNGVFPKCFIECYHSASKTHVRNRIFKLSPIHASVIFRFPEFAEFSKNSALFRKNSNILCHLFLIPTFWFCGFKKTKATCLCKIDFKTVTLTQNTNISNLFWIRINLCNNHVICVEKFRSMAYNSAFIFMKRKSKHVKNVCWNLHWMPN